MTAYIRLFVADADTQDQDRGYKDAEWRDVDEAEGPHRRQLRNQLAALQERLAAVVV